MKKKASILSLILFVIAASACSPPQNLGVKGSAEAPKNSSSQAVPAAESPSVVPSPALESPRDWVSELLALGYQPDNGSTQWIDEMMFDRAPEYCMTSLSGPGDEIFAKAAKMTEFELAVTRRIGKGDESSVRELKTIVLIMERFCDDRIMALKTVIRMHPEMGVSTSDL